MNLNNPIGYKSTEPLQKPFIMNPFRFGSGVIGGWKELDRTILTSAGRPITVSGLENKRYYMVLTNKIGDDSVNSGCWAQFNTDSGSNYAYRNSSNGGADTTGVSQANGGAAISATPTTAFGVRYVSNLSSNEKLVLSSFVAQSTAGSATAPLRRENVFKWANSADSVSSVTELSHPSVGEGEYAAGSEVVVLGWDPDDSNANFWEELDSVTLSSTNANLASNTFTAKKYLWIQIYLRWDDKAGDGLITFNGDTGSNYSDRNSYNGGTDFTSTNASNFKVNSSTIKTSAFVNIFTINNSSYEKLTMMNVNGVYTAGAGTAPDRRLESVSKWTNTSSQITSMNVQSVEGGAVFDSGTTIKVWGSD